MDKAARIKLRVFISDNVPLTELRKFGFFGVDIGDYDYERIAGRICDHYGYKSIYEYKRPCTGIVCNGRCDEPSPYCVRSSALKWDRLIVDVAKMVSEDSWLN